MKHLTLQNIAILVLLCAQVYLMYEINQNDDSGMEEINKVLEKQRQDIKSDMDSSLKSITSEIVSYVDTFEIIEGQKTTINNHYEKSISDIANASPSEQLTIYKVNSARFDSLYPFADIFSR